jgi:hypothetical protein
MTVATFNSSEYEYPVYTQEEARAACLRNPFLMPDPIDGEWFLLDTKTDKIVGAIMSDQEEEEKRDEEWGN